ncbi:MAG: hypothetical protein ACREGR_04385, partial [Minisyncoccia bacterium]
QETINGWWAYYGAKLAEAQAEALKAEAAWKALWGDRFHEFKDIGGSDKYNESKCDSDDDVVTARNDMIESKRIVKHLETFLKAMAIAHDNATSRGHTLRKELGGERTIYAETLRDKQKQSDMEDAVNKIVGRCEGVAVYDDDEVQ